MRLRSEQLQNSGVYSYNNKINQGLIQGGSMSQSVLYELLPSFSLISTLKSVYWSNKYSLQTQDT